MSRGFRQSQAWLHTWSGLLVGWVLYAMFLTGTSAYWREEITRWMTPELGAPVEAATATRQALAWLETHAQGADAWTVQLPGPRTTGTQVSWRMPGQSFREAYASRTWLDADGHAVAVRDTRGGDFFYRLHFDMHYMPVLWGRWLAGICAMFMLVAIVSGVVTHRKIFADFFTFRRGKGQRSWLDGHNALAVLALPFHLMITYTGLITLMALYMPFGVDARYADAQAFYAELFPQAPTVERSGTPAPLGDVEAMRVRAAAGWQPDRVDTLRIDLPGDAAAQVVASRSTDARIVYDYESMAFSGTSGALVWRTPSQGAAADTRDGMVGLHAARFAPMTMRWLFFLSSLAGTLMVASGLVLWTVKRRAQLPDPARPHFGFRLVESLNIGFVAGLPAAMAVFFWANRLLPTGMAERAQWEIHLFFLFWLACVLHACVRRPVAAWREQLAIGALLFAALPVYNLIATHHGLFASLAAGDTAMATMEIGLLVLGAALGWAAWAVDRHARRAPARLPRRARVGDTQVPA
ncbi:PepSY domain-containing protein [Luteimonas sp. S4-F44]|uniref:PepSY-associated TM helix domain-containing protein n=1 Tax=Luteimonas sp. S4-F44 TaxID=2925842 RepID=UPI001F53C4BB|nr:PepSY-associated TM helix domain-containing protein [Luteimonas sp. S4-F44]UNK43038.1 PepSY domain-containing protein [Luteimonas sp. S4-F44]